MSWHGLSLELPEDCSPVKLDGDAARGAVLIADLRSPRLGLRWTSPARGRRFDANDVLSAMRAELGQLAASEATPLDLPGEAFRDGRLFVDRDPPGRDVWVGVSHATGRLIQLALHVKAIGPLQVEAAAPRERDLPADALVRDVLPMLSDDGIAKDKLSRWSVFDVSCIAPAGYGLQTHRLNAGDLTLTFARRSSTLILRQIAPAKLALARQDGQTWLSAHARVWKQMYREAPPTPVRTAPDEIAPAAAPLANMPLRRRRRFCFAWWAPKGRFLWLDHDLERDRLILTDCDDLSAGESLRQSVGWAQRAKEASP